MKVGLRHQSLSGIPSAYFPLGEPHPVKVGLRPIASSLYAIMIRLLGEPHPVKVGLRRETRLHRGGLTVLGEPHPVKVGLRLLFPEFVDINTFS